MDVFILVNRYFELGKMRGFKVEGGKQHITPPPTWTSMSKSKIVSLGKLEFLFGKSKMEFTFVSRNFLIIKF